MNLCEINDRTTTENQTCEKPLVGSCAMGLISPPSHTTTHNQCHLCDAQLRTSSHNPVSQLELFPVRQRLITTRRPKAADRREMVQALIECFRDRTPGGVKKSKSIGQKTGRAATRTRK